jgi:hypothetical protein
MGGSSTVSSCWTFESEYFGQLTYCGQPGVYGTLGTPAAGNTPGARDSAANWTDSGGHLWLFGGNGADANGIFGRLNDLWEFNPSTNQWAWMGGSSTMLCGFDGNYATVCVQAGVYGTLGTPAAGNIPRGREYAVSWTGNDGNFWLFGGTGFDVNGNYAYLNDLWKYQPMASLGGRPRPSDRRGNRSSGSRTAHSSFVTSPRPRIGTLGECQSYPFCATISSKI